MSWTAECSTAGAIDVGTPATRESRGVTAFCHRHYALLAIAVLALAAFNLTFRLGSEIVTEWDESLYAITASEIIHNGDWIGTTFLGSLDYYNTKPPLNVWLIAIAFKALGTNLISLRLVSVLSAWLTVAVLMWWGRRLFGPPVALLAGLVLSSSFGFLYVHAARSANTDALFTLLILLTVVSLWAAQEHRWRLVWVGPLAAAVFLLKGTAVLMPLAIVLTVTVLRRRRQPARWLPAAASLLLFLVPVVAWAVARWQVDQWQFIEKVLGRDFLAHSLTVADGHSGSPLYYLGILVKHQYDWLLLGAVAWMLYPVGWAQLRTLFRFTSTGDTLATLLLSYAGMTLLIPTLMVTKLAWYLNPFYPVFAIGIAWLVARGFALASVGRARPQTVLACAVVLALTVAEGKLLWYSFHHRDLRRSVQGLLLAEGDALTGHRVFRERWDRGELFVIRGVLGAERGLAVDLDDFMVQSRPGDYLVSSHDLQHPGLAVVQSHGEHRLYRLLETPPTPRSGAAKIR
jgi:4-amino-4-deoxy-L-arabinose transferase-like glycosyltransferase